MPPVSILMKPASGNCNMRCDYCFYCDEQENRKQKLFGMMEEQTLRNLIRKAFVGAEGSVSIAFQGGEPTLRGIEFYYKAVEYVKHYNKKNLPVTYAFQTNGTNIDEDWCRLFQECGFLVGISMDGTWKTHNRYRHFKNGKDTFETVMEGIQLLEKHQIPYNVLTVVHNETVAHVNEIYKFYNKKNIEYQQYIPCIDPLQKDRGVMVYSLNPESYGEFLIRLFKKWEEDVKKKHMVYIRQFDNYVGILKGHNPEACDQRGCCGIQYVVEADGSVYPCDFYMLDPYYLGNVNENSFKEMDQARQKLCFMEESLKISEDCLNCRYLPLCRGGCQRNRVKQEDGTYKNYFCKAYRIFFDECADELVQIAASTDL